MPRYLTISDDLQIIPSEGWRFISKSHRSLESVESDVRSWVSDHPVHPRIREVEQWLTAAEDKILETQVTRTVQTKAMAIGDKKREIRRVVREYLWSKKCPFKDLDRKTDELSEQFARELLGYDE
jgi:hypothetical protein